MAVGSRRCRNFKAEYVFIYLYFCWKQQQQQQQNERVTGLYWEWEWYGDPIQCEDRQSESQCIIISKKKGEEKKLTMYTYIEE